MKKVLSFVLVLAMVLGSVAMAFAVDYSDMEGSKYAEAVETLSSLGVLNGYEDGTFKADREIKRSEFAKVVIEALGLTTSAASTAPFSDVEAGKWYTPYVALAAQMGIVNGYGDGTFRPDQTITDTQAIVMVVRALGYTDEYFGGYNAAKYISQATALGIMDSVNAGTGASTRGNVAQLVFNALDVSRVAVDKDGNVTPVYSTDANGTRTYDTMQTRLAGKPVQNGRAFVYGSADPLAVAAATGVNAKPYLGKYITAVSKTGAAPFTKVKTVESKTLVGTFDGASTFKTTDGTSYTFNLAGTSYNTTTGAYTFNNGAGGASAALSTAAGISIEVAVNGVYITQLYSQSVWTPTNTFLFEKDDLDTTKCELDGGAYKFAKNNQAKIDETSFEIAGVDKIADIAVGNVVTVYTATVGSETVITKLEVGTKTVEGQVTEKTSAGKYVIGGTAYELSAESGAVTALTLGNKGTYLLDYSGNVYAEKVAEAAATNYMFGIPLQFAPGQSGIYSADAKVQLVTADGATSVLVGDDTAAPSGAWAYSTTGSSVAYTLNDKGQVHGITTAGVVNGTTSVAIAKDGTANLGGTNYKFTADTKILVKGATKYTAGKAADYYGATVTLAAYAVKGTTVLYAVVEGSTADSAAGNYVMLNGWTEKYNAAASSSYYEVNVLEAGAAKNYKLATAGVGGFTNASAAAVSTGALYNFSVDNAGNITSASAVTATTATYTTKTAVENSFLVTDSPAQNYPLAANVVVYVWKSNAWTVGSVTDLAVGAGYTINLYDTNTSVTGAEVVTIAK